MEDKGEAEAGTLHREAKSIARHAAVYGLGNLLQRAVSFIMIPFYTHYLAPADYGILQVIVLVVEIVGILTGIGISASLYRFYFESDDPRERNTTASTAAITFALPAGVVVAALAVAGDPISRLVFDRPDCASLFTIAFASIWFNALVEIGTTYLRIRERSGTFLTVSLGRLILALSLNIYFIAGLRMKVHGILLSTLITSSTVSAILLVPILARVGLSFRWGRAKELLRFGAPLVPSELAGYLVHGSDRMFIVKLCPAGEALAGIYSLGYKLGNAVHLFVTSPFIQIWQTRRFALWRDPRSHQVFARIFTYLVGTTAFAASAVTVGARDALRLMSDRSFWGAESVVPWIAFAYVIFGTHYHLQFGILVRKKTYIFPLVNGIVAAFNLGANYLLIGRLGILGAALATVLSYVLKAAIQYAVSRSLFPLPLEWSRLARIGAAALIACAAGCSIYLDSIPASIAARGTSLALFPLTLWATGFLSEGERKALRRAPAAMRNLFSRFLPGAGRILRKGPAGPTCRPGRG